ncbi:hypothetical protein AMECASPLE_018660 [Ameca splendens]|uniref:Secreted protein n=1 Tax=Ameca splendens TaxID=208324 RepID=A0ABV0YQ49_9TELE
MVLKINVFLLKAYCIILFHMLLNLSLINSYIICSEYERENLVTGTPINLRKGTIIPPNGQLTHSDMSGNICERAGKRRTWGVKIKEFGTILWKDLLLHAQMDIHLQ